MPEKAKMPRRASLELRQRKDEEAEVKELHPVEVEPALEYIVTYFRQVGPTMGDRPVTFGEMDAFCNRTGVNLDEFECMAIRHMSDSYLGELHRARDPQCPCPALEVVDFNELDDEAKAAQRAEVSKKLGAFFAAREESQGKGGLKKRG